MNNSICKTLFAAAALGSILTPAIAKEHKAETEEVLPNASSTWVNQSGSTMSFTLTATSQPGVYKLDGSYVNNATGFGCQGTSYPMSGVYYIGTSTMSFSVAWSNAYANCRSVTGWTGYYSFSDQKIHTDWNLSYVDSSGNPMITSGSDVFTSVQTVQLDHPFDGQ